MSERPDLNKTYPPNTGKPCSDCPWRRNAKKGWLGPYTAMEWVQIVHGDSPIACHQTITETNEDGVGDWDHPAMRQCRGAAIFREHVCKSPKNPSIETGPDDPEHVFVSNAEFLSHHTGQAMTDEEIVQAMHRARPR